MSPSTHGGRRERLERLSLGTECRHTFVSERGSANASEPRHALGYVVAMSENQLKRGDAVRWKASQGTVVGKVEKKLTEATAIEGHTVAASPENPQYLVKSDKTGARAAHKPKSLKKIEE